MKLSIGGTEAKKGWTIYNAQPGPSVDVVGCVTDMRSFESRSVDLVYASHVIEHLGYADELPRALREMSRILKPGGKLMVSVPDLDRLCRLFSSPHIGPQEQFQVMRIMFGGQIDEFDFHHAGFTFEILGSFLSDAGFATIQRVKDFGLFAGDCSSLVLFGAPISLNVEVQKRVDN